MILRLLTEQSRCYHALTPPSRGSEIRRPTVLLLGLSLLALSGCGGAVGATPSAPTPIKRPSHQSSATPTIPAPTAAPANSGGPTPDAGTATVEPTATPKATPSPATSTTPTPTATPRPASSGSTTSAYAWSLQSASLQPASVAAGATLSATVMTSGAVTRVEMYLGSGAPGSASPKTFPLTQSSTGTWTGTGTAPAIAGTYHFTVGIYTATGRHIVDNDGWDIQVTGASTSASSVAPLPADIPLAPPFSYGNPVPATFTGAGKPVSGAEVVSNARPDVSASAVASFYEAHLARAGWSVDRSSVPAGASSFSVTATKAGGSGTRVCIVQYSGSAVHILYGSAG